ncbi:hypothetical protein SSP35_04_03240 [Streptomyces sp. NBRC 110611]|nr:hypothetical protein SSP35_04_03240 [Streptomyces sp. NBRC 110611]
MAGEVLCVDRNGRAGTALSEHGCAACAARGYFCRADPPCQGGRQAGVPVIPARDLPPV